MIRVIVAGLVAAMLGGFLGGVIHGPAAHADATSAASSSAPVPRVVGNRLLDSRSGTPWTAHAVNWPSFEYACQQGWGESAAGATAAAATVMASWGITAVRIPLNQDCWLGVDGAPATGTPASYRAALADWVSTLNRAGLVVILDLHWTAPTGSIADGQRAMPDAQSVTFWSQAAAEYKNSPSVLFETFNEPYSRGSFVVSWSCWLNGGCQVPKSSDQSPLGTATYAAHGQAEIVAAIRTAGASQPILLDGLDYANDLRGWLANRPNDAQLIASWHNYPGQRCQTASCWNAEIAPVTAVVPVIATEFGETDGGSSFLTTFMDWADAHGIGYAPWAWWVTDASDGTAANLYALITDLDTFSPRAPSGSAFRDHLLALSGRAAATSFVRATYTDVLGRTPDVMDAGVQWWVPHILAGVPRSSIASGFTNSDEYRSKMILAAYTEVLHRAPEPSGGAWWLAQMQAGHAQPDDAHRIFLTTDEFYVVEGGNADAGFVTALYQDILQRSPDPDGLVFWENALRANGRASVVDGLWGSTESLRKQVTTAYADLLGRTPNDSDAGFWMAVTRASGPTVMRTQILASDEYWNRAATRFP